MAIEGVVAPRNRESCRPNFRGAYTFLANPVNVGGEIFQEGESKMQWKWMAWALLAVAIASPSSAQISVYIGTPPPAIVYEEPGAPPGPGFAWIEGYWTPAGH